MISESVALKQAVESLRCSIKSSWVGCKPEFMSAAMEFENIYICVCVDMCVSFVELARVTSLSWQKLDCERVTEQLAECLELSLGLIGRT